MQINDIKEKSKIKLNGNYIRCASSSLFYFIIFYLITLFQYKITNNIENSILLSVLQAFVFIINWILNYGIISNILDLSNIKTNSITDFINTTIKYSGKYIKIGLNVLIRILVPLLLFILSIYYWFGTKVAEIHKIDFLCFYHNLVPLANSLLIISIIVLLYFILKYVLVAYIYYENPTMSVKDIINKSKELMKGKKFQYIILLLSFLHWFLICALILFILSYFIKSDYYTPIIILFYSIIRPYIVVSKNEFYRELEDIKEEKPNC